MARNPMDTLRSILTLARRPGTRGEGEAAMGRAVAIVKAHGIQRSAVASLWPAGWDFDGKRIAVTKPTTQAHIDAALDEELMQGLYDIVTPRRHSAEDMLDLLMRATKGKYSRDFLREALRRAKMAMDEVERKHSVDEQLRRAAEQERVKRAAEHEKKREEEYKNRHQRKQTRGSIGAYARDLLRKAYGGEPYSYGYILGRILDRYPNAKTTVASLRWYENEMRNQGIEVPKGRPAKG